MRVRGLRLPGLGLLAVAAAGQLPVDAPGPPVFSAGIKLRQVSVIAENGKGKPVLDLRREDLRVFDNGAAREISLFAAEAEKTASTPTEPMAPGTFANRIAPTSDSHSGYSVILIDSLFTGADPRDIRELGSANTRLYALRALRSLPSGERIAIYSMERRKIQVIGEFTQDRNYLEEQLRRWKPSPDSPEINDAGIPEDDPTELAAGISHAELRAGNSHVDSARRVSVNGTEMDLLADHLAGIPGRKNLIWLSNRFVIGGEPLARLTSAGVSVYPVDIDGVPACGAPPCKGLPRPVELMQAIARLTGGLAYFLRNDLDMAIREAVDDGRNSYTIGFHQTDDDRTPQIHRITVTTSRPDVTLRYAASYQTTAPSPAGGAKATLLQAMDRPIDATAISVRAQVTRSQDRLSLKAKLETADLDLTPTRGAWTGKLDIIARFTTSDGSPAGKAVSQTVTFNLSEGTYEAAVQKGLACQSQLTIPPKAVGLRLLFSNLASGKIGTLTIPLTEVPVIGK